MANKVIRNMYSFVDALAVGGIKNTSPLTKEWVNFLFLKARSNASEAWKQEIEKRIDYYHGRQTDYLERIFQEQFKNNKQLLQQLYFTNVVKQVIDKISVVYTGSVKRELKYTDFPDREVPQEQIDLWNYIQKKSRYDRIMQTVNKYVNLVGTVLIRPRFSDSRKTIMLDILTPNIFDVMPDEFDPQSAYAVIYVKREDDDYMLSYDITEDSNEEVYFYWDKEFFKKFTISGEIYDIEENEEGVNPYGVIPFAKFVNEIETEGYYIDGGYELINAQDNINIKLTELNNLIKFQTFSIPVIYGDLKTELTVISPSKPIVIPLGSADESAPRFEFVTPSPNITTILEEISQEVQRIAQTYGLSMNDFKLEGSASSGVALKLQNRHLDERRLLDRTFYEDSEQELFDVIKSVWNVECQYLEDGNKYKNKKLDENLELFVAISDPVYPDDPQSMRDQIEWELEKGFLTKPQAYMKLYGCSEQEAISQLEKVKQEQEKEDEENPTLNNIQNPSAKPQSRVKMENIEDKQEIDMSQDENDNFEDIEGV